MSSGQVAKPKRDIWKFIAGTPDRAVGTASFLMGVLSLILTLVTIFVSEQAVPWFVAARDVFAFVSILLVALFFVFLYLRSENEAQELARRAEEQKLQYEAEAGRLQVQVEGFRREACERADVVKQQFLVQLRNTHDVAHTYKERLFDRYFDRAMNGRAFRLNESDFGSLESICISLTARIRTSIKDYLYTRQIDLREDLSVSIKLVIPADQALERLSDYLRDADTSMLNQRETWIITFVRDPYTHTHHPEREKGRRVYDVAKNTAFSNVIELQHDSYLCNDLRAVGTAYRNENDAWGHQYNAVLVTPIRYKDDDRGMFKCYGLLAVDSSSNGVTSLFDDECVYIMRHAADLLATFFLSLDKETQIVSREGEEDNGLV